MELLMSGNNDLSMRYTFKTCLFNNISDYSQSCQHHMYLRHIRNTNGENKWNCFLRYKYQGSVSLSHLRCNTSLNDTSQEKILYDDQAIILRYSIIMHIIFNQTLFK